jgi:hypothetical protein
MTRLRICSDQDAPLAVVRTIFFTASVSTADSAVFLAESPAAAAAGSAVESPIAFPVQGLFLAAGSDGARGTLGTDACGAGALAGGLGLLGKGMTSASPMMSCMRMICCSCLADIYLCNACSNNTWLAKFLALLSHMMSKLSRNDRAQLFTAVFQ